MRKVTREIVKAFRNGKAKSIAATYTTGNEVYLHQNKIAWRDYDGVKFNMCGWGSVTTRERINGMLTEFGYPYWGISQRKGKQCLVYKAKVVEVIETRETISLRDLDVWEREYNLA